MSINTDLIIAFTPSAAEHIQQLIHQTPGCKGFKLSIKKGGCTGFSYVPELVEIVTETDLHWIDPAGFSVFIDPKTMEMIKGTVLDYEKKGMGQSQLRYKNPNIKQACGCGESFNVYTQTP